MTFEYLRAEMDGKVCVVTGANSGIGYVTARTLAEQGATVVMLCRDKTRGLNAQRRIAETTGNEPELLLCDFAELACVREVAGDIVGRHSAVDVLVNNAGGILPERLITEDGNELTFQVNHLAHFLLTNLLLQQLEAAEEGRILSVSSDAHFRAWSGIYFDDLTLESGWSPFKAYAHAKLAQVMFAYELARRLEGTSVASNALTPGGVNTGFGSQGWGIAGLAWDLMRPLLKTPEEGAQTTIYLATAVEVADVSGGYFKDLKPAPSSPVTYDDQQQQRLWDVSAELVGLS